MSDAESRKRYMEWLYPNPERPCLCESAWVSMGRLHGISMGHGWARTTTHPNCYHHGTAAQAIFKKTKRWPPR